MADPYRSLEDPDGQGTRAFIEANNSATRAHLDAVPGRDVLARRLREMWSTARVGVPEQESGWLYYVHNTGLQGQAVLVRARSMDHTPQVVLDPNTWSPDATLSLAAWAVSPDGRWLVYGVSDGGTDWITWRVRDLEAARDLPDEVHHSKFSWPAWLPDSSGFLYGRFPEPSSGVDPNLDHAVYLHRIGTTQSDDLLVHSRPDQPRWGFHPRVTDDHRYMVLHITAGTAERCRIHVQQLGTQPGQTEPTGPVIRLLDDFDASYRYITNIGTRFLFETNLDAPRHRVIAIDLERPERERWVEVVPEHEDTLVEATAVGNRLFLQRLHHAAARVHVTDLEGNDMGDVTLPELGTTLGFSGKRHHDRTFFHFTSLTRPPEVWSYDLATGETAQEWAPQQALDPARFHTEQHFVTSKDGTLVPVFVTYADKLDGDGDRPTLLYGYGGFNHAITPTYDPALPVWLELGGVFVVANLRGGGEYGRDWHEAGTLQRKQNVFDDFIATAEWLTAQRITRPERLAIHGRSNGGLLVGATLVQRPELFGAALPAVGVLDMLRYHRFTIGWAWASDYGTSDDPEMFETLLSYSPLHNARPARYPPTLVMTADHDDRVVPAHSYKFAAALQHAQQGEAPVLLRVETRAGHGLGKSTGMLIDEKTDLYTFLASALGVDLTAL